MCIAKTMQAFILARFSILGLVATTSIIPCMLVSTVSVVAALEDIVMEKVRRIEGHIVSQQISNQLENRSDRVRRRQLKKAHSNNEGGSWKYPILHAEGILKQAIKHNGNVPGDIMMVENVKNVIKEHHKGFGTTLSNFHHQYNTTLPKRDFLPAEDFDILDGGELIVWKAKTQNNLIFSAYNHNHSIVVDRPIDLNQDCFVPPEVGAAWTDEGYDWNKATKHGEKYEPDYMSKIGKITEIKGHHIFWGVYYQGVFAHIMLDYIAYFAHIKEHLPRHVKILILDSGKEGQNVRRFFETIDPTFVKKHVTFVPCAGPDAGPFEGKEAEEKFQKMSSRGIMCHDQLIRVKQGSLIIAHPKTFHRHIEYISSARKWIEQSTMGSDKLEENKRNTVVFQTRSPMSALETSLQAGENAFQVAKELQSSVDPKKAGVAHGRVMNLQEDIMLVKLLQREIDRYNNEESNKDDQRELVIFDGTLPLEKSIKLFQSADIVIGPHGGGMANIFFMLGGVDKGESLKRIGDKSKFDEKFTRKSKVLEFITSPLTPDLQEGVMHRTYFYMFNTAPWIDEYHHIFYTPPSSDYGGTYVNLDDYMDALKSIFRSDKKEIEEKA